jgi:hypothetical protein
MTDLPARMRAQTTDDPDEYALLLEGARAIEILAAQVTILKLMVRLNALRWIPDVTHTDIDRQIAAALGEIVGL